MLWYHRYLIDVLHDSVLIFSDFKPLQMLMLDRWEHSPIPPSWMGGAPTPSPNPCSPLHNSCLLPLHLYLYSVEGLH